MTQVDILTTQHSFKTTLEFTKLSEDAIGMRIDSECPHLLNTVQNQPVALDPMIELFRSADSVLTRIADQLPHRACPFLFSALKGLEIEAGLERPVQVQINVRRQDSE
ncbi:MAG TPA: hypothetical protein PK843_11375 [bacterium]|nr:hypothetical protein [bacterium]HPN35106.1 hypothetical protein [bacterium]